MRQRRSLKKKNKEIHIRVDDNEHKELKLLAKHRGITLSRFVIEAIRTYVKEKT